MKKIFALLITLFYCCANAGFAFSELYYLKNTTESKIKPIITSNFYSQKYKMMNDNPYYAVSQTNSGDYAVIVLQQSGQNMFYYYQSNNNKKMNNNILKSIKNSGVVYEQSFNTNILKIYDNIAQKTLNSGNLNKYSFDDEVVPVYLNTNVPKQVQSANQFKGYIAQLEAGTVIKAYLQTSINTSSAQKGDRVVAILTNDVIYNGHVVIPQGTAVYGILTMARHATYGSRNGRVVIEFNQMVTPDNQTYDISAEKIDFTVTNDGKFQETVSNALVGAAVGALSGLIFGALGDHNLAASAAIGAGIGAGGSLIGSTAQRGVDAEIPSFTEMELTLTRPLRAGVSY